MVRRFKAIRLTLWGRYSVSVVFISCLRLGMYFERSGGVSSLEIDVLGVEVCRFVVALGG